MIRLRGMTWKHDRGLAPMIATAAAFQQSHPEIEIQWESRSLSEFGEAPVAQLAKRYDLVVLDHPYMGELAKSSAFLPLDDFLSADLLREFQSDSAGRSHQSYQMAGHQWALAIDAAAQVAGYRVDLLEREGVGLPHTWLDVFELARIRRGFVSVPLWPLDSLICFFTLCANLGDVPLKDGRGLVARENGMYALDLLRRLRACSVRKSMNENPIAVWERMSSTDETAYCPLAFGYSNYSRKGYRSKPLSFDIIPSAGCGPVGATLGGAGLAISAGCAHRQAALDYASWVACRDCQRTLYVESGGQPGRRSAWEDDSPNRLTAGYFHATLPVIERAWVRPRFCGFVQAQNRAAEVIASFLKDSISAGEALQELDRCLVSSPN
ncbi:MAG TPA: extracellular solute-binding protein [Terracidiphilus sp.]|nr:extracellular solute-binding protein [Terracidiphilus sp.]